VSKETGIREKDFLGMAIEIEGLSYSYGADADVLRGVALGIREGEVFGVLGPSGSGKSTLQSILLGFRRGYTGSARMLGHETSSLPGSFYRNIGVSFELPASYQQLSARENLELFASLQGGGVHQCEEVLSQLDLLEHADKRVSSFSKGMKMRLNLARALMHDPDIYLLDEPTSGQDPARARCIREIIIELSARGKTVLVTTHNMEEAEKICDRVGFLFDGKIAAVGAPDALKKDISEPQVEITHEENGKQATDAFHLKGLVKHRRFRDILARDKIASMKSVRPSLEDVYITIAERSGQ